MIVKTHDFSNEQYMQDIYPKKQIVLHHTVSGDSVDGDIGWWLQTPSRVATSFIIDRDGTVHVVFHSKYWAHHLGVKSWMFKKHNLSSYGANLALNKKSIGIELDSWGGLVERHGKYYRTGNKEIDACRVIDYGKEIRGFRYYEKYTDAQLKSLKELLKQLCEANDIPKWYHADMWEFNRKALQGVEGIWTHVSFRPDKSDCHPQPELLTLLQKVS